MAQIAVTDADQWALPQSPVMPRLSRRRPIMFVLVGLLAYCFGLIAMIPASLVLPKSDRWQVGGTIWNGEAVLGGTTSLNWQWSPIASLSRFAFAANWHMTGGNTDLIGSASPGFSRLQIDNVSGVADGNLLNLAAPTLPMTCKFLAKVNLDTLTVGGSNQQASGNLRTSPVHCTAKGLAIAALDFPALNGKISPAHGLSSGALITLPSGQHLVEARLYTTGAFSLWPTAALIGRVPALGGTRLPASTAASQQGLLQIVRDFCQHSNAPCAGCRFPELVHHWKLSAPA